MEKSYKVLKEAVDKVGAKKVASELGVSTALVYKWCQKPADDRDFEASGANNPIDRLEKIYKLTKDQSLIDCLCELANSYRVDNFSDTDKMNKKDVVDIIPRIIKEFSETLDAISKSYNDDKLIDEDEAKLIRKEWNELKSLTEGFVRACEEGVFAK